MPSQIELAIARFRAALLAREAQATGQVIAAYAESRARLVAAIDALAAQLETAESLTVGEALRLDRAQALLAQVDAELVRLGIITNGAVANGQAALADLATNQAFAGAVVGASAGGEAAVARVATAWNRVNTGAVEAMVGRLSDGSPLADWIGQWGQETADSIRRELTSAVALGTNPRTVAAQLETQVDVAGSRLLATTRTAQLSAYRDATRTNMLQNADILDGVVWVASLSDRTCSACLAMHGEVFPVDYRMDTHINCRCTLAPHVSGVPNPVTQTGEDWLATQPQTVQDAVMTPSGGIAYRNGDVSLRDFVRRDDDPRWGASVRNGGIGWARQQAANRTPPKPKRAPKPKPAPQPKPGEESSQFLRDNFGVTADFAGREDIARATEQAFAQMRAAGKEWEGSVRVRPFPKQDASLAHFNPVEETVHINSKSQYWEDAAARRRLYDNGWLTTGDDVGTIVHEVGHALHWERIKLNENLLHNWTQELTAVETPIALQVSRYAATTRVEFVAEVFSGRVMGKTYSREVMEMYISFGGPLV